LSLAVLVVFLGLIHSRVLAAQESKPEVFIWYANETSLDDTEWKNWDTLIAWLRSSDNEKCRTIAGQLETDREDFPAAVEKQMATLKERLPKYGQGIGAAFFTNGLVKHGKFLLLNPGDPDFREVSIVVPKTDQPVLANHPLSRPEVLTLCLEETARHFDPATHDFVLVTKSHGNAKMAVTPRIWLRPQESNREEVVAVVSGAMPEDKRPAWTHRRFGITKDDFFTVVGEVGWDQRMQFSLVFIQACDGVLGENVTVRPPDNIRRLYMTGTEKTKKRVDYYAAQITPQSPPIPLSQCLDGVLAQNFPVLIRGTSPNVPVHLLVWWSPLLVLLSWLTVRRLRRRNRRDLGQPTG